MSLKTGTDVIVVNYRTPEDLQSFVSSYDSFSGNGQSSLYIANVAPEQHDLDVAEKLVETQLNPTEHIVFEENVGYAKAVNEAATRGNSNIIAIFNADTRLTAGLLDECYKVLVDNPDWGVLGPRQLDSKGRVTHAGIFGTQARPKHRDWHSPNKKEYEDVREAVTVSGSAYFIRRSLWKTLTECEIYREVAPDATGAFLPTPLFYEETWCSYHAKAHGSKVMYYGPAVMYHDWHVSITKNNKEHWANEQFKVSRDQFREACKAHGIPHD